VPSLEKCCLKVSFQVQLTQPERTTRSLEEYFQRIYAIATNKARFAGLKGHLTGKEILEALDFDL